MTSDTAEFCIEKDLIDEARPVVESLRARGLFLVTAESCTAGLVAAVLSHIPGIGECFHGAFVAYSKEHKTSALGVDAALLHEQGSVNAETAVQMGMGALRRTPAQIAVAVTGVLGPDADEDGNPPGVVYIAICRAHFPARVQRFHFQGPPDSIRRRAVRQALAMLKEGAED